MTWFLSVLLCILCWSATDLCNKRGTDPEDKGSHLKFLVWLGLVMGALSCLLLPWSESGLPVLFLIRKYREYIPFALAYVLALMFSMIGVRFLDISVISPLENIDGAIAGVILLVYFVATGAIDDLSKQFTWLDPIGIVLILAGTIFLGMQENQAKKADSQHKNHRLGAVAFLFPMVYNLFDAASMVFEGVIFQADGGTAVGEFDFLILEGIAFLVMGVGAWFYLLLGKKTLYCPFRKGELVKGSAALTEGLGNVLFALAIAQNPVLTPPVTNTYFLFTILGAKRILKEKLSKQQYICLFILSVGILLLGISEVLKH